VEWSGVEWRRKDRSGVGKIGVKEERQEWRRKVRSGGGKLGVEKES
jgi:hypothetical protein